MSKGGYIDHPMLPFSEPDTSRAAAVSMAPSVGQLQSMVLAHIRSCHWQGVTDDEGEHRLGLHHTTYAPRRNELVKLGLVEDSGNRRVATSGRRQKVWIATAARKG